MTYKELLERVINEDKYKLYVTGNGDYVELKFLIPSEYYEQIIKEEPNHANPIQQ